MKVFLSWSGRRAQVMAEDLRTWLQLVIQAVEPFVSSQDIHKGERGLNVIADELEGTSFGIICVTRENSQAPWINFEAGALSKVINASRVVPVLLDLSVSDVTGPLRQFQAVSSTSRDDVFRLVDTIREYSGVPLKPDQLKTTFDMFWPILETAFDKARTMTSPDADTTPARSSAEVLEEVLVLARRQEAILRTVVEHVDSSIPMREIRKGSPGGAPPADGAVLPRNTQDRSLADAVIIDNLLAALAFLGDTALAYRVITDRLPEEVQVYYDGGAISAANVDEVCQTIEGFANGTGRTMAIKTKDGYHIIARPEMPPTVVLEPQVPSASRPVPPTTPAGSGPPPRPTAEDDTAPAP